MGSAEAGRAVVIIPAFNEESCIGSVVDEIRSHASELDVVVVNDGSSDGTAREARKAGAVVLDLPTIGPILFNDRRSSRSVRLGMETCMILRKSCR